MKQIKDWQTKIYLLLFRNRLFRFLTILVLSVFFFITMINSYAVFGQPPQNDKMLIMEEGLNNEFENHFNRKTGYQIQTSEEMAKTLQRLDQQTGTKSAVIWVMPKEKFLHISVLNSKHEILIKDIDEASFSTLVKTVKDFVEEINEINTPMNLTYAQKLYQWIVEPLESEYLEPQKIDTLLFCLGNGVRGLPLSALHDGKQFLIEKYSLTQIPGFSLIEKNYIPLQDPNILAMGASQFTEQNALPAVSTELSIVTEQVRSERSTTKPWQGKMLYNETFTLENMAKSLTQMDYDIVHLATHADFQSGVPQNSYIQFWDGKLTLDQMSKIQWKKPPELLVLSACNTAVGDRQAELGFTGLALQAGVKSVLGSLWSVSDSGTLALISEFYEQLINKLYGPLVNPPTKAEALRKAQLLLLQGKIYFKDNNLFLSRGEVSLPKNVKFSENEDLSHPFYWAAFTLISSPW